MVSVTQKPWLPSSGLHNPWQHHGSMLKNTRSILNPSKQAANFVGNGRLSFFV